RRRRRAQPPPRAVRVPGGNSYVLSFEGEGGEDKEHGGVAEPVGHGPEDVEAVDRDAVGGLGAEVEVGEVGDDVVGGFEEGLGGGAVELRREIEEDAGGVAENVGAEDDDGAEDGRGEGGGKDGDGGDEEELEED